MRLLAPLALTYTVHRISRRVGLASKTTMGDLARYYAVALDEMFQEPVDVLGISTGGSLALQLAADRRFSRDVIAFLLADHSPHASS
jgi:hypothetical protein